MSNWEVKCLDDVCDLITCGVAARPNYIDEGIPFLSAKNVKDGKVIWSDYKFISEKTHKELTKSNKPQKGDLLYTRVGSYGEAAVIEKDCDFSIFVSLTLIKVNKSLLYNYYLKHYLNSDFIKKLASESISGSGVGNLNVGTVRKFPITLPLLPEQKRIVAILDEAFAAIDKAKANAEKNLKNARELFESYLQRVFDKKGEGWEEKRLGEVLTKTETIDPTKKPNKEFIYLDVSSVNKNSKEIENATVLLGKDAPSRARKLVRMNDVIFATVRPTHSRVAIITQEYDGQVCSTGYFVMRAKECLNKSLVFYFLLTCGFNRRMAKLQKGASYPAVTDSEVKSVYIPFPKSLKVQQTIVLQLDALRGETKKLEEVYQKKIADLEELKKSFLQKAFTGKLRTEKAKAI